MSPAGYDAVLVVSFGGPEAPGEVMPFLENVLRGRPVPRERMLEVAEHYHHFGGRSPIAEATRRMLAALRAELERNGPRLPVYGGNRNWHPYLADALRRMAADGVGRALAFVTSAFGSYSGCRQYLEDIERARAAVGANAPVVDKLRLFYNHPEFVAIMAQRIGEALAPLPEAQRAQTPIVFTAHSIPMTMAANAPYQRQLESACQEVMRLHGGGGEVRLAYQSRSGAPAVPWLDPDVLTVLRGLRASGAAAAVVVPIGFLSDHMEVVYDLDTEAGRVCDAIGLRMLRAGTAGAHPRFAAMVRELIAERTEGAPPRWVGALGPWPAACPAGCCAAWPRGTRGQAPSGLSSEALA